MSKRALVTQLHPQNQPRIPGEPRKAPAPVGECEIAFQVILPGGETRWIRTHGTVSFASDGRQQVVCPTIDIADASKISEERAVMLREMSHRVKNLFTVVSSLVRLAPKRYENQVTMADELAGRITSLARVYDLARRKASFDEVQMGELIDTIVLPHIVKQKFEKHGSEDHTLRGDALNTFTMIVHELTTNALKHGALSKPDGEVWFGWNTDQNGLTNFTWEETIWDFVVPVDAVDGFGSSLLRGSTQQLGGTLEREFTDHGVRVTFSLMLAPEIP